MLENSGQLTRETLSTLAPAQLRLLVSSLTDREAEWLTYQWALLHAREKQLPPEGFAAGAARVWVIMAGRGWGKTRTAAEQVRHWEETGTRRIALVAKTPADARDVMVEDLPGGPKSGLVQICPPWNRPRYEPSKRRLTWPSGCTATVYSGEEPEQLRGPAHEKAWVDELSKFRYPRETWANLWLGLRMPPSPQVVVSMTPRTIPTVRRILERSDTVLTHGSTYENRANLSDAFFEQLVEEFEGTRLARQELWAELLEDTEGALWSHELIDLHRVSSLPVFQRVVVGVDPSVAEPGDERASLTGIVVAGRAAVGRQWHGYVIDDVSLRGTPHAWATRVIEAYHHWQANVIVAEKNQGGEMIRHTLHTVDPSVPVELVTASRGKMTRAEPVASLYEKGVVHHYGSLPELEDQMCTYAGHGASPDRMDAAVWALTALMVVPTRQLRRLTWGRR